MDKFVTNWIIAIKASSFNSIAAKNALAYAILFLIGIASLGYLLLQNSSDYIIESAEENLVHSSELIQLKFSSYFEDLKRDITHLSNSPILRQFLDSRNETNRYLLSQEYLSLLTSKPDYAQVRFIGIQNEGKEIVRVERNESEVILVGQVDLQNKGSRDYFQEAIQLPKDSIYISPIDLNKEYGQISLPPMPTLRVAYPIFSERKLEGIIVINANLELLFQSLNQIVDDGIKVRLINRDGHYFMHENKNETFGFEYNRPATFALEFESNPQNVSSQHSGVFLHSGVLYTIDQLFFPRKEYAIYVMVLANKKDLFKPFYAWRRESFVTIIALAAAFLLLAFMYLSRQTKKLKEIIRNIKTFPQNLAAINLTIQRKDEIGELAQSISDMSSMVSQTMNSLEQAKLKAEEAVLEKEEFLENMSHEIRNPLQSIIGICDLLENNNPGPHQLNMIKSLQFSTKNLQHLVQDILDYKKLQRGEITLNNEWRHIPEFFEELIGSNRYFALTKKIQIRLVIDSKLRDKDFFIDRIRLSQILNNLIINAIKFTESAGNISVQIRQLGDRLHFEVEDTGIGIDSHLIAKIKDRYFTGSNTNFSQGAGLGLPIIIGLLEIYNSQLHIQSKKGEGSNFSFQLTIPLRMSKFLPTTKNASETHVLSDLSMLIIDDDELIISLYKHLLIPKVKELKVARNITDLATIKSGPYHLVICDLLLGENSLLEYQENLSQLTSSETLIYIISALSNFDPSKISIPRNVKFLQKPIVHQELLWRIVKDVRQYKFGKPNFYFLKKDYDFDPIKYQKALLILLSEWVKISKQLQESIQDKDLRTFNNITHKFITSLRRLELEKFESLLASIKKDLEVGIVSNQGDLVTEAMIYYEHLIAEETESISGNQRF